MSYQLPEPSPNRQWVIQAPDSIWHPWRFKHQVIVGLAREPIIGPASLWSHDPQAYAFRNERSIERAAGRALARARRRDRAEEKRELKTRRRSARYQRGIDRRAARRAAEEARKEQVRKLNEPWIQA